MDSEKKYSHGSTESCHDTHEVFPWQQIGQSRKSAFLYECKPFPQYPNGNQEVYTPEILPQDELSLLSYCNGNFMDSFDRDSAACAVIPSCRTVAERRYSEGWGEEYMYPEDFPLLANPVPTRHISVEEIYPNTTFSFEENSDENITKASIN